MPIRRSSTARWWGRPPTAPTEFAVRRNELKGKSTSIVMVVDLPYLSGYDLRKLPLVMRRSRLKKLIAKTAIQSSESFAVDGPEMCKDACSVGLEGWPQRSATAA